MALWKFGIITLYTRYLKNLLSCCLETWQADRGWLLNDLINLNKKKKKKVRTYFLELYDFENLDI